MKAFAQDRRIAAFPTAAQMATAHVPREHYFDQGSYWYQPITDYTPYQHPTIPAANSANWAASLRAQMKLDGNGSPVLVNGQAQTSFLGIWAGVKTFVVPGGYPRRPFQVSSNNLQLQGASALDAHLRAGVPAPPDLIPGGGADHSCVIYQPDTDTLWDFYNLGKTNLSSSVYDIATWGGVIFGVSEFKGTFGDLYRADGVQVGSYLWGGPATSISLASGLTTVDELASGVIPHALPLIVAHAQFNPILNVTPANRGDGDQRDSPGYAPEGVRVVFPPGSDFSRVRPEFMPFATAARQFGFITTDKTGGGVTMKIREGDPWNDVLTLYNTDPYAGWRYMQSLPWDEAIVVDPALSA